MLSVTFFVGIRQYPSTGSQIINISRKMSNERLVISFLVNFLLISALSAMILADDHEHAKALKDFVPDHPHLHDLVDKTHKGDLDAKHQFEREALSVRFNATRQRLPADTDEEHVVLHFLDDYTAHVSGSSDHKFMELEPFIAMLSKHDDLREKLVELGKKLERAECDFSCMGDNLGDILNKAMQRMMSHTEL